MRLSSTVHFIGISGIGMSALARILLERGHHVSGSSDRLTWLTQQLSEEGATIAIGHRPDNVGAARTVVVSSAIDASNPELVAAHERGLAIVSRGRLLAHLMSERRGIAVAGTHGKTTTTAMIAHVLEFGGLDPTVIVGGERHDTGRNARDGAGAWLVCESDESDLSFLDLRPEIAVVTNVENDHVASDADLARLIGAFETFLAALPAHGLALVGIDEPRAAGIAAQPRSAATLTFGFERAALRARDARYANFGVRFVVERDGLPLGEITTACPGAINVQNALPAIGIGLELGLDFSTIARALAAFQGVRRRFEVVARSPRMTVVDDYAHHPTAVAATIAAARRDHAGPIVVAFQPHRYSRTQYLAGDFARALSGADAVVLTDVYAASEAPIAGVNAASIGEPLRALGGRVSYVPNVDALPAYLLERAPEGALVLLLGAGSITDAAAVLGRELTAFANGKAT